MEFSYLTRTKHDGNSAYYISKQSGALASDKQRTVSLTLAQTTANSTVTFCILDVLLLTHENNFDLLSRDGA